MKWLSGVGACLLFAASASAAELFDKTHGGERENRVAESWSKAFPDWVRDRVSRNQFVRVHLAVEIFTDSRGRVDARPLRGATRPYEIREAGGHHIRIYSLLPQSTDPNGRTVYRLMTDARSVAQVSWDALTTSAMIEAYDIGSVQNVNDLVAFGAWLYGQNRNEAANRALTIAHGRDAELAPLIEAYIAGKEGWALSPDGLTTWKEWDPETQAESAMLITPREAENRKNQRERAAPTAWREITTARGDTSGNPPRRRRPQKSLNALDWEIRQFRLVYAGTSWLANQRNADQIEQLARSIAGDRETIEDQLRNAGTMPTGNTRERTAKGEFMELILGLDPHDPALVKTVADVWFEIGGYNHHARAVDSPPAIRKAIAHLERLVEIFPANPDYLMALGYCWQVLQDSARATPYYQRVIDMDESGSHASLARQRMRQMELDDRRREREAGGGPD